MSCVGVRSATLMIVMLAVSVPSWGGGPAAQQPVAISSQQLKDLSLEQLGNVEVTTEFKEPTQVWNTPSAIYVLTGEDIRRSGVTNVPDALRLVPGVNVERVNGSRNWAVGIRGFGDQFSKYVLVLIDGRSVYTPLFGGVYWMIDNVMLEDIDRIEVVRGPGGTIWGEDAVNGVINIITKSSQETKGTLLSSGGGNVDQNTEAIRFGSSKGKWSYRADLFGFVRSPEFHIDGQRPYDWSRLGQFGWRADRKAGRDEVQLSGDAYWGKLGDAQNLSPSYAVTPEITSYASTNASGGNLRGMWRRNLGDQSSIYLQGFWAHEHRIGSNFAEDRDTIDIDFLHRLPDTRWHHITYGAGVRVSPSLLSQVIPTQKFIPANKVDSVYSGFLQDDLHLVPGKLGLSVGTKLASNNYTGFEFQPNGRLLWTPTPKMSYWVAVSRAVRIPDRVDDDIQVDAFALNLPPAVFARVSGNPNLRVERMTAYEEGFRALVHPKFYIDFAGFHNDYHDIIAQGAPTISASPAPFPAGSLLFAVQYQNGIHGNTDGAEISPDWQPTVWWRLKASYSYLHINLKDQTGFTDTATLTSLHGSSPNSQVSAFSQFDLPGALELDQTFRFVGALPAQSVKAYATGDVRLGWKPSRSVSLSVTGQNLLQPHHAEFNIDPSPMVLIKRGIYAKIVWTR